MTAQEELPFKTAKTKSATNANGSNTDKNMCKVHQSETFSHFCITCSGKICALCTQENAEHYEHETIDLDTLDSYKRELSGSGQVEDVSNCIDKAKASFDAINKLVSKQLNGTAKSRIKEVNIRLDKVLEQVEDIRRSCVTAILREAQTELTKTASSRERRAYAQHDKKRRTFKKQATNFLQQGTGNLKVLKDLQKTGVPLHFLKVNDVDKSKLPEISSVKPISKDLSVLEKSVQQLSLKAKQLFESAVGAQIMFFTTGDPSYRIYQKVLFYDIVQNKWSTGQAVAKQRIHTAITTWNSKVILAGGQLSDKSITSSVKQFDPLTNTWTSFPDLHEARRNHALVNLEGSLYAIGGYGIDGKPLSSAERFNKESNSWEPAFTLQTARAEFAAAVELSSRVFITGGKTIDSCELASCETYRGPAFQVANIAPLNNSRYNHSAAANLDTVYVFGGLNKYSGPHGQITVEQYDRHADQWTVVLKMRYDWISTGFCFDGSVHVLNFDSVVRFIDKPKHIIDSRRHDYEFYNDVILWTSVKRTSPTTNNTKAYTNDAKMHRSEASTTNSLPSSSSLIMKNLLVYICEAFYRRSKYTNPVFDIEGNSWQYIKNSKEDTYKFHHSAVVTWNNTVVVAGGYADGASTDSVVQFDPLTGMWTTLPNLNRARSQHALVNVNGSLYVFGGETEGYYQTTDVVERYDANEPNWADDGNLCIERTLFGAAACKKGVVLSAGYRGKGCELYDTKHSSSTIIACLNIDRWSHASATHDDTVYVFGGINNETIEQYDGNANSWTLLHVRLPELQQFLTGAVCVQDKIYILSSSFINVTRKSQEVDVLCFVPLKNVLKRASSREHFSGVFVGVAAINVKKDQCERILLSVSKRVVYDNIKK